MNLIKRVSVSITANKFPDRSGETETDIERKGELNQRFRINSFDENGHQ